MTGHGDGLAELTLWSTDDGVVCAVHDDGPGVDDPFADGTTVRLGIGR